MPRCSTPEGVIVWVTVAGSRGRAGRSNLLNARRRHRLGHPGVVKVIPFVSRCSTPEGVIVWVTTGRASSRPYVSFCSTPEGVIVWVTITNQSCQLDLLTCSTPEGVIVWVTASRSWRCPGSWAAQRPKASSSGSHLVRFARPGGEGLLNARRRHRLGHVVGVVIGGPMDKLLNARRRHRLGHPTRDWGGLDGNACSTPEGVIVWVTKDREMVLRGKLSAQRPKASSSGSHLEIDRFFRCRPLLNARRRHRLGHTARPSVRTGGSGLLNARRRHRLGHVMGWSRRVGFEDCSTPEGVIVWVTFEPQCRDWVTSLLNARRRHRLGHDGAGLCVICSLYCSTPEGVIVWVTRPRRCSATTTAAAQRPKASSSGSQAVAVGVPIASPSAQRPKASSSGSPSGRKPLTSHHMRRRFSSIWRMALAGLNIAAFRPQKITAKSPGGNGLGKIMYRPDCQRG